MGGLSVFLFLLMIYLHIVDDFYMQGWLASAKQRKWWEENAPDDLYQADYIMALAIHSISWSFMVMLPVAISMRFDCDIRFLAAFVLNAMVHMVVDDLKANQLKINLVIDQLIHLIQITITALAFL